MRNGSANACRDKLAINMLWSHIHMENSLDEKDEGEHEYMTYSLFQVTYSQEGLE